MACSQEYPLETQSISLNKYNKLKRVIFWLLFYISGLFLSIMVFKKKKLFGLPNACFPTIPSTQALQNVHLAFRSLNIF